MLNFRRLRATFCILALSVLTTACEKNKVAEQPPVVNPPSPAASRPKRRQAASPPAHTTPHATAPAPAPAQPASPPRLGQILSPSEERQFNSAIDQSLANAKSSLNSIGSRSLSREQITAVQQIKDFMQQAQVVRTTDLLAAKGLADKADVLARDLLRSVR
jgi:hypothetical protein